MDIFAGLLWFLAITAGVTFALPRVLDAILYYYDGRTKQLNEQYQIQERTLVVMKEQLALQQRKRQ